MPGHRHEAAHTGPTSEKPTEQLWFLCRRHENKHNLFCRAAATATVPTAAVGRKPRRVSDDDCADMVVV